jgi:hypothetical protein
MNLPFDERRPTRTSPLCWRLAPTGCVLSTCTKAAQEPHCSKHAHSRLAHGARRTRDGDSHSLGIRAARNPRTSVIADIAAVCAAQTVRARYLAVCYDANSYVLRTSRNGVVGLNAVLVVGVYGALSVVCKRAVLALRRQHLKPIATRNMGTRLPSVAFRRPQA